LQKVKKLIMSEQELRKYRLTDVEEPTDEQLAALMHAAGEEARRRGAEAEAMFQNELEQLVSDNLANYSCGNGK
jgi:endonuclease YncB( thermonuclease family)